VPIKTTTWMKRMAERSDLSSHLVHLTRGTGPDGKSRDAVNVLLTILRERRIKGSNTNSGFIVGNRTAVCLQDAPLYHLAQNVHAEELFRKSNAQARVRYVAVGLALPKAYVYRCGGRPVFYEQRDVAKRILPKEEHWRIVNYDLTVDDLFTDWTHEREWRLPGDLEFSLDQATVILSCHKAFALFIKRCSKEENNGILEGINGVVSLGAVYF
jgi:hypothetical protein